MRVQLKAGIEGSGRVHTNGFNLVLAPGETAEVTEEEYQRHLLASGLFEQAREGAANVAEPPREKPRRGTITHAPD